MTKIPFERQDMAKLLPWRELLLFLVPKGWKHNFRCTAALHRRIRKETAAMQVVLRVTGRTSLQIPPQPAVPDPNGDQPYQAQSIISPERGMEVPLQTVAPPTKACTSPGPAGKSCWNLDIRVAMSVLTLAGVVILLLLYRLLQMRHRCVRSFFTVR